MIQKITTDPDCGFLNFLNDGKEDKIYPPLRMYKDKHFLFVDGKDSQKISVSRNNFKVLIDGTLYNNLSDAETVLNTAIECVNKAAEGGTIDPDAARKMQQILQIEEAKTTNDLLSEKERGAYVFLSDVESRVTPAFPFDVTVFTFSGTASGQGLESAAVSLTINNMDEFVLNWNANISSVTIEKRTDTSFYILPGTKLVPDTMPDNIAFNDGFLLSRVYRVNVFSDWYLQKNGSKSNVDVTNEKLGQLVSDNKIHPLIVATSDPVIISGNVAEPAILSNPNRKSATIYVEGGDLWIRPMTQFDDPTARKGIRKIQDGGGFDLSPNSQNGFYLGTWSVINAVDGETPTFYTTEST